MAYIRVKHVFEANETFENLGLWVIPVKIQGEKKQLSLNFLLDTGSQITILSPEIENIIGITRTGRSVIANALKYGKGVIENLEIGSIPLGEFEISIGQLPGIFAQYQISGLLGSDILKGKGLRLKLNYHKKTLKIEKGFVSLS